MSKTNSQSSKTFEKPRRPRPGIHSKTKTSRSKKAKNYKKKYRGQGR